MVRRSRRLVASARLVGSRWLGRSRRLVGRNLDARADNAAVLAARGATRPHSIAAKSAAYPRGTPFAR